MPKRASRRGRSGSARGRLLTGPGRGVRQGARCVTAAEGCFAEDTTTTGTAFTSATIAAPAITSATASPVSTSTRTSTTPRQCESGTAGSSSDIAPKGDVIPTGGRKASQKRMMMMSSSAATKGDFDSNVPAGPTAKRVRFEPAEEQAEGGLETAIAECQPAAPGGGGNDNKGKVAGSVPEAVKTTRHNVPGIEEQVGEQVQELDTDQPLNVLPAPSWSLTSSPPSAISDAGNESLSDYVCSSHSTESDCSSQSVKVALVESLESEKAQEEHGDQYRPAPPPLHRTSTPKVAASGLYSIFNRPAQALTKDSTKKGQSQMVASLTTSTPVPHRADPNLSAGASPQSQASRAQESTAGSVHLESPPPGASPTNIPRPHLKSGSAVWSFFATVPKDENIAICSLCRKCVSRGKKGSHLGTSSQITHLKRYHNRQWLRHLEGLETGTLSRQSSSGSVGVSRGEGSIPLDVSLPSTVSVRAAGRGGADDDDEAAAAMHHGKGGGNGGGGNLGKRSGGATPQSTLLESFGSTQQYHRRHAKVTEMNTRVAIMLAVDLLPFSFVENKGFLNLMQSAQPHWKVPSRSYFSCKAVPELYEQVRMALGKRLDGCFGVKVHLTMNMWPSGQSTDYLTVTGHWVCFESVGAGSSREPEPLRQQATLCMQSFNKKSHTAKEVWEKLQSVINEWLSVRSLQPGFVCSDNASNISAALKLGQLMHVPYMAHVLNLVVTHFLMHCTKVTATLAIARNICAHFSRSYKARNALHELQVTHNLPRHQLIMEVDTRWISTLQMLQRLDEQRKAIMDYCITHYKSLESSCLSGGQWGIIEDLCRILGPFQEATLMVSQADAGISASLPVVCLLEKALTAIQQECENKQLQEEEEQLEVQEGLLLSQAESDQLVMVKELLAALRKDPRIAEMMKKEEYLLATFVDPRFRDTIAEFMPGYTPEEAKEECSRCLARKVQSYLDGQHLVEEQSQVREQHLGQSAHAVGASGGDEGGAGSSGGGKSFFHLLQKYGLMRTVTDKTSSSSRRSRLIASELVAAWLQDEYLAGSDDDPLLYWQGKRAVWPMLARVAVDILSCPGASVLSKHVFSGAGSILTDRLTRLSPANVERMIFIKMNAHLIPPNYVLSPEASVIGNSGSSTEEGLLRTVHLEDAEGMHTH